MKTTLVKENEIERNWLLVDATNKPLGRLAVQIAALLRGKNKVTFAPHIDQGDFVVVTNAAKVKLTGNKEEQKIYKHYTGYSSGLREFPARHIRAKNPTRMVTQAVAGMLPKNKQSRGMLKRLRVFADAEHMHAAQKPEPVAN
jgi:large subunit ribosomal protein L13